MKMISRWKTLWAVISSLKYDEDGIGIRMNSKIYIKNIKFFDLRILILI